MVENKEQELAFQFLQNTSKNIFLTGKAGTGKTTFLKSLETKLNKRFIVLAPTGVAALNAGGVTLHSFFQLPFHIYIPGTFPKTTKFSKRKIDLIRSLDLIIIDEISMVRCDILDEIDAILKRFRRNGRNKAFGGVQVMMIGDLNQLPPIANEEEEKELAKYYNNLYFFSSRVLLQSSYETIPLKHIYRQQDPTFVGILNEVRENRITFDTINKLNQCYQPNILNSIPKDYIVLCTHNKQADSINEDKLNELKTKEFVYKANIEGTFPESIYPNAYELRLKEGCQVMFIKNDYDSEPNAKTKRYYNGKIGIVKELMDDAIVVQCPDSEEPIIVQQYTWENVEYKVDEKSKEVSKEVKGEFTQYPLKLAWAITIHKSQGLTFEKAIINSNRAFSHGQVYVALSRCRSLQGMILSDRFSVSSIILDNKVKLFNDNAIENMPTEEILARAKETFLFDNIASIFDFTELSIRIKKLKTFSGTVLYKLYPLASEKVTGFCNNYISEIEDVDLKYRNFINATRNLNTDSANRLDKLLERSLAAKKYFLEKISCINDILLEIIDLEFDNREDSKLHNELVVEIAVEKELKYRLLNFLKDKNFSVTDFLSYKNNLIAQGTDIELASIESSHNEDLISKSGNNKKTDKKKVSTSTDIQDQELYNILRNWRYSIAQEKGTPAYTIVSQTGLIGIVNEKPRTKKELLSLKGIGPKTAETYGKEILEIIDDYLK